MQIELTQDEVLTVLIALDTYRQQKELAWLTEGFENDQEDAGSAEWIWQKIMGIRDVELVNAEVRANSTLNQETFPFNTQTNLGTTASVDPFDKHPDAEKN
tara:strand:- start:441 stop:743 length:303 start_codon:yes stop_codon:yes gene_type:complete